MYLHSLFPAQLSLQVVELDPSVIDFAKRFFGLIEDDRLRILIGDGAKYISEWGMACNRRQSISGKKEMQERGDCLDGTRLRPLQSDNNVFKSHSTLQRPRTATKRTY